MRKEHPAFRMRTAADIATHLKFREDTAAGLIAYQLNGEAVGDAWKKIMVIFNGTAAAKVVTLPKEVIWRKHIWNNRMDEGSLPSHTLTLKPYSASILYVK